MKKSAPVTKERDGCIFRFHQSLALLLAQHIDAMAASPFDGNIIIEAWKYPPVVKNGEKTEWVDRLSLAVSLRDNYDARVQGELVRLIERSL